MTANPLSISPALAPVRRQIEDRLRDAIYTGVLKPGEKLIERDLCTRLGVSRTSLREALRQLEAEGLINLVPYRGPEVAYLSLKETVEIYQVRELLEGFAGQQFAQLANNLERSELEECFEGIRQCIKSEEYSKLIYLKEEFYRILLSGARNEVARETLLRLNGRVRRLRSVSLSAAERPPQTLAELETVMAAIRNKDPEAARIACAYHVQRAAEAALKSLEEHLAAAENQA
ncbi:GntR family transcriptional regulator [Allopusillimonas ginsengisoli]|uniref:GntR family transcriptional regulator n=1 Tax=Allopusillimonas ginsengisoli TaxID=453575 RepID=UPI00102175BC|nr:GntR family transcriptional regulator [Allopusillimonas ginsengisoli]TEA76931.1 GntR family transcriptional regulator [Allopusillimonas ginsengisoli]